MIGLVVSARGLSREWVGRNSRRVSTRRVFFHGRVGLSNQDGKKDLRVLELPWSNNRHFLGMRCLLDASRLPPVGSDGRRRRPDSV